MVTVTCGSLLAQVINTRLRSGAPELWEQVVDFDTKRVLRPGHYVVDRKQQRVSLTTEGMHAVLRRLGARAALCAGAVCPGLEVALSAC